MHPGHTSPGPSPPTAHRIHWTRLGNARFLRSPLEPLAVRKTAAVHTGGRGDIKRCHPAVSAPWATGCSPFPFPSIFLSLHNLNPAYHPYLAYPSQLKFHSKVEVVFVSEEVCAG